MNLTRLTGFALMVGISFAQSQKVTTSKFAFDVASVKENKSGDSPRSNFPLGPGEAYVPHEGLFSATDYPFLAYIMFAYDIMGNQQPFLQPQLPAWAKTDRFDIQARAQGNPTKDQMRLMMRSLLADRFKLATHFETRQVPVLALRLSKPGKLGPQLALHPNSVPCSSDSTSQDGLTSPPTIAGGFPALCGTIIPMPPATPGDIRLGARNVTLNFFADLMSGETGLSVPILDRTGLNATFDFTLEWKPQRRGPDATQQPASSGVTLEEALGEQLGLKLQSAKGPFDVLVIDHLEKPSEN